MKKVLTTLLSFLIATTTWAVPARKTGVTVIQPDGSKITVYQHGDEHFHWQTNEKGEWIEQGVDGFFRVTNSLNAEQIEAKRTQSVRRAQHAASPLNVAPRGLVILVNFADVTFETEKAERRFYNICEEIEAYENGETEPEVDEENSAYLDFSYLLKDLVYILSQILYVFLGGAGFGDL
jgi:hypothetical protein